MAATTPVAENRALLVGTSDGIGLALAQRLLAAGWRVVGISRSPSRIDDPGYEHLTQDVAEPDYPEVLRRACDRLGGVDLCVYCAGIGEGFDPKDLAADVRVFAVNLMGALTTIEVVGSRMVAAGSGHLIGLSSMSDQVILGSSPSYCGSKAGLSTYLRCLAPSLRPHGVFVTTVRFGFVDTKMAKSPVKPMLITAERAAEVVLRCVRTRPAQISYPRRMALLSGLLGKLGMLRTWRG